MPTFSDWHGNVFGSVEPEETRVFSPWHGNVAGAVLEEEPTRLFSPWHGNVTGSVFGDRVFSPWHGNVVGAVTEPAGVWQPVFFTDFSGQATGTEPLGFTPRYATNSVTFLVEADTSMTANRRLRMATGSGTFDRMRSVDVLDGEPNVRIIWLARAQVVMDSPWAIKLRATGTTGTGNQNDNIVEYSVTAVAFGDVDEHGPRLEMRLHKNLQGVGGIHNHLVTATDRFVTFEGDDTPTITSNALFNQLQTGDMFWLDAQIIGRTISYKFWRVGDAEPTEPNSPGWIVHTDLQSSAIHFGDWSGIVARRGNSSILHIDTLEAFVFQGVQVTPPADFHVTDFTENTIDTAWTPVDDGAFYRLGYQLASADPENDPFLLAGEVQDGTGSFQYHGLSRGTSWRLRNTAYDPVSGEESEPIDIIQATAGSNQREVHVRGIGRVTVSTVRRRTVEIRGVGQVTVTGVRQTEPFSLRFWHDNFEDTNGTPIQEHTADSGQSYDPIIQQFPPTGRIEIIANRAASTQFDLAAALVTGNPPADEYDIYFTLRHFNLINGGRAGVIARASGASWPFNFYRFAYDHNPQQWVIADAGGPLVALPEPLPIGAIQCRAEVRNAHKRLWVFQDGVWTLKLETTNNQFETGTVGIYSRGVMGADTGTHISAVEAVVPAIPIEAHTAPTGQNYTLHSGAIFIFPDLNKAFSTTTETGVATIHPQPPSNEYDIQFEVDRQSSVDSGQFGVVFRAQPGFSEGYSAFYDDDEGFWSLELNGESLGTFEESLSTGTLLGRAYVSHLTKELAVEESGSWVTKVSSSNNSVIDGTIGLLLRGAMDPISGSHINIASAETVGDDNPVFNDMFLGNPAQEIQAEIETQEFVEISGLLMNPAQGIQMDLATEDSAEIRIEAVNPAQTISAQVGVAVSSDVIFNLTNPRQTIDLTLTDRKPSPWHDDTRSNTTARNASRFIWRRPVRKENGGVDFIPAVASAAPWIVTIIDPIVLTETPTENP